MQTQYENEQTTKSYGEDPEEANPGVIYLFFIRDNLNKSLQQCSILECAHLPFCFALTC